MPAAGSSRAGIQRWISAALWADLMVSWIGLATAGLLIVCSSGLRGAGVAGSRDGSGITARSRLSGRS
ncbi:hypothetical protein D3C78_1881200 [compost metagenome]